MVHITIASYPSGTHVCARLNSRGYTVIELHLNLHGFTHLCIGYIASSLASSVLQSFEFSPSLEIAPLTITCDRIHVLAYSTYVHYIRIHVWQVV